MNVSSRGSTAID